ncbi:MAG: vWA domain-containing protein [Kiritimatiellia bacterium]
MLEFDAIHRSNALNRPHVFIAFLASFLSLLLHTILLFLLLRLPLDFRLAIEPRPEEPPLKPLHVADVRTAPPVPLERPKALEPGEVSSGSGQEKGIEVLGTRTDVPVFEPPALPPSRISGEQGRIAQPAPVYERRPWEPRQEIYAIEKTIATVELAGLRRRRIPAVERISKAPDVVATIERDQIGPSSGLSELITGTPRPGKVPLARKALAGPGGNGSITTSPLVIEEKERTPVSRILDEIRAKVTPLKPIERVLSVRLFTYQPRLEPDHGYFRAEIYRAGATELPTTPKDVVLVQDCSASMDPQRLYFCKQGWRQCLAALGENDRFNVVRFHDSVEFCFPGWAELTAQNLAQADRFIAEMEPGGNTDLFASLVRLLDLPQTPGRPLIVLLTTDGVATKGVTSTTEIIGQFSRLNQGRISLFAVGVLQTANKNLLDLLTYSNRGDARVVTTGRWDIPAVLVGLLREVSRPVLSDVRFRAQSDPPCQIYPSAAPHLYLDRPLVIYGRYPRTTKKVALQAIGMAGSAKCDLVFNLNLEKDTRPGGRDIRDEWARHRVFHLMSLHARYRDSAILEEIQRTIQRYNLDLPYSQQP